MRITFIVIALFLTHPVLSDERRTEAFAPLAFLAGSCFSGTFPDGKAIDEHCFSWMYDGAFLRDVHVVGAPGRPDYRGTTIYYRDGDSGEVAYHYYNSLGGVSDGVVRLDGNTLRFPDETYRKENTVQTFRSSWQRNSDGGYVAVTEEETAGGWKESFRIEFSRSGPAAE